MGDGTDGLRVSKARDEPAVHDRKDRPLRLHRGVSGLIQDAAHLSIAFGAAVTVVDAGTLLIARARAHPGRELFRRWKPAALAPTSAMICCAESTPRPGT